MFLTEDWDDEDVRDDEDVLAIQVSTFNRYSECTMFVEEVSEGYFHLYIDGDEVTTGDYEDVLTRVKGINRENRYNDLGE